MRLLRINAARREIFVVEEADPEALIRKAVLMPQGMVDIDADCGMIVCPIGIIGSSAALWWHHGLGEVFGGDALVVGIDGDDQLTGVPEGTWQKTRRAVEFLGAADEALPRLRELVQKAMGDAPTDERQGILALEPPDDLHR